MSGAEDEEEVFRELWETWKRIEQALPAEEPVLGPVMTLGILRSLFRRESPLSDGLQALIDSELPDSTVVELRSVPWH